MAVREMGFSVHGFDEIASYTGAPRDVLADRLGNLEAYGIVARRQYAEDPSRHEYHLTQAGQELLPMFLALTQWGDRWVVEKPSVTLKHDCGHTLQLEHVCGHCSQAVTAESVSPASDQPLPGPAPVPRKLGRGTP